MIKPIFAWEGVRIVIRRLALFSILVLGGCASYSDSEWEIRPGEAGDSIAIEHEGEDMVCVRELSRTGETTQRTCVPAATAPANDE